ncbi:phospholipase D family protein [Tropicibacter sp. R15_0]|uniref:phospholipase D family protein n=1 Tax=Tropicibacter sp. R15_0 TaxID=2821101 RepID=UPI001ADD230D|nr:phospholipase D family protein [Tropicibacter sp. R15_0]MBO9464138.1 phospholipase D family protein [Tropicibacter sp. R15_0]
MKFILQAVNGEDHLAPAREVFTLDELQAATISTAFMTASGLSLLQGVLEPVADRTRLFVGIRNGVTTVQSIQKALEIGCETYMVDTGSRQRIFHPKMYYARSAARAKLLLGSANLTMGGLRTNIEASVMQELDPATDAAFLADLEGKFDAMIADYPDHVIRAVDAAQLADLQRAGRLLDERKTRPPEPAGSSADRDLDAVPKMALRTSPVRVAAPVAPPVPPVAPAAPVARERLEQVWESNGLTRRHLNIPTGANTNPTGSMLLGVGAWAGIDQRHYFRDDVFAELGWVLDTDPRTSHIERADVQMRLIIKDVDYGERTLQLSHNTLTNTKAYEQRNSMTSLHWGDARPLVAHEDLLDRVLKLFRETGDPTRFTLEID